MKKLNTELIIAIIVLVLTSTLYSSPKISANVEDTLDRANDKITTSRSTIITETVKKVNSSVVGINVTEIRQYQNPVFSPFANDPFF